MPEHIVLAYSGGLDTSVVTHWLQTTYDADVTACLVDLGQESKSIEAAKKRALANGAKECIVTGSEQTFASDYVAPGLLANALYQGVYPLATALARPLIASELVEVAHDVGADAVAHGCTGKGNDQVRIEASVAALDPSLETLAPQRTHAMTRDEALAYADEHDLQLPPVNESTYSTDVNLWGRSIEGGVLEDPTQAPPEEVFAWTNAPEHAPDTAQEITLSFQAGLPVALDGRTMPLHTLASQLNEIAGTHGVGRIDHIEDRLVGIKSREIYEAPGAVTVLAAKHALETLTLTKDVQQTKAGLEQRFSELVYDGQWFTPLAAGLSSFFETIQQPVTGEVTLEAYKGSLTVASRSAQASLYDEGLATYGPEDGFDHEASTGFIQVHSLPLKTAAKAQGVSKASPGGH